MEDSVFNKIIRGEIPAYKIYEDADTLVFLDIDPLLPGHVLVVPKQQIDHIDDLPDDLYQAVFATVKKVAGRLKQQLPAKRAIVLVMGYDVPHAHVHVIPSPSGKAFYQANADRLIRQDVPDPDHAALSAMAERLAF